MNLKCGCCGYENPSHKWSRIESVSCGVYSSLVCRKYDVLKDELNNIGSVRLFACPICNMITWER